MLSDFRNIPEEDATQQLIEHTDSDENLDRLNESQRIVLASHRFAPEVTSTALWLNEQTGRNLVTSIQMVLYKDPNSDTLYLSANNIIPTPGAEDYQIGVGSSSGNEDGIVRRNYSNNTDNITRFCRTIHEQVVESVPDHVRSRGTSSWAGGDSNWRYYHMWHSDSVGKGPVIWGNWNLSYRIELSRERNNNGVNFWNALVSIYNNEALPESRLSELKKLSIADDIESGNKGIWVDCCGDILDDSFAKTLVQITINLSKTLLR